MTIKILSTHAVMEAMNELAPQFERANSETLSFSYDPANVLKRRIDSGEAFDVAIVTRTILDELTDQGKIVPDTRLDVGRSGLGVSVRKGERKPDIGTVDHFKRALLSAKSVVRSKDGTSGVYFEKLLERLGIAGHMQGKVKLGPSGRVAVLVAKGEADMAVQQISELLPVTGVAFVGPFPEELQLYTMFSAGIGTAAKDRDAARGFINSLVTPNAVALFKAKGLEPVPLNAP